MRIRRFNTACTTLRDITVTKARELVNLDTTKCKKLDSQRKTDRVRERFGGGDEPSRGSSDLPSYDASVNR